MKKYSSVTALILVLAILFTLLTGCSARPSAPEIPAGDKDEPVPAAQDEEPEEPVPEEPITVDPYVFPVHTAVPFTEMGSDNFDAAVMDEALNDMTSRSRDDISGLTRDEKVQDIDALKSDFDTVIDCLDRLETDFCVAEVYYSLDYTDDEAYEKYNDENLLLTQYAARARVAVSNALKSAYGEYMKEYISSDSLVQMLLDYVPLTEDFLRLTEENNDIVDRYYDASAGEDAEAAGAECSAIYLELLDNLIAKAECDSKHDDYPSYSYEQIYFRDYTPDDLDEFRQWVKDYISNYFYAAVVEFKRQAYYSDTNVYASYSGSDKSEGELLDTVGSSVIKAGPLAEEAFSMMVEYGLYDFAYSETKTPGAFETYFPMYGTSFIYLCPYGSSGLDTETLIHEFGHFYESYTNRFTSLYSSMCIDTCEIDSQGLEFLMFPYSGDIFGSDLEEFSRIYTLYSVLFSVIEGCIFDEFQQTAYAMRVSGELTDPAQLSELYISLEKEYFGEHYEDLSTRGSSWWTVPHSFTDPFYYISYATSAAAALSLLCESSVDYDKALERYNALVALGNCSGFVKAIEAVGLPNPLTSEGCEMISEGLSDYLRPQIDANFGEGYFDEMCPAYTAGSSANEDLPDAA